MDSLGIVDIGLMRAAQRIAFSLHDIVYTLCTDKMTPHSPDVLDQVQRLCFAQSFGGLATKTDLFLEADHGDPPQEKYTIVHHKNKT